MGYGKESSDRRADVRFKVENNAIAVLGPLNEGLGELVELSLEGFSFLYHEDEQLARETVENLTLFGEEPLCLGKVPIRTISDHAVETGPGDLVTRRCGVQFGELTPSQKNLLEKFIYENAYFEV